MNVFQTLGYPCRRISGTPEQIEALFLKAMKDGTANGFTPLIYMQTDSDMLDSSLMECQDAFDTMEDFAADTADVCETIDPAEYTCDRWKLIQADLTIGMYDDMRGGESEDGFSLEGAKALYLVEIPVQEPWKIFEKIPFGGFGGCPENGVHEAFARHWYKAYGAVPALLTDCCIQYYLPEKAERSSVLNRELVNYCPCLTEYIHPDEFALQFSQAHVWFFFWDDNEDE